MFCLMATRRTPSEHALHELEALHAADLERLLPKLGPLFSLGVILFAVWDHLIDPPCVARTLPLRAAAVLIGSLVCLPAAQRCSVTLRCAFLY